MVCDPHAVHIFVDGSCFPHDGRRSGYAGVVLYPEDSISEDIVFQGFEQSTINRMELSACIAAMGWVREHSIGARYSRVQIFSDSQYVVNCQRSAIYWQRAKWRNSGGRPIDNHDLWKEFVAARAKAGVRIDILKVLNKSTQLLKLVDKLAKSAAKSAARIDRGLIVGKLGRSKVGGSATIFPAANQELVIRIVSSKTAGPDRENRFVFEVFNEETQTFASKHFAYCTAEIGGDLHRHHGYRVRMNDKHAYPQILRLLEEVPLPKPTRKDSPKSKSEVLVAST